MKYAFAFLIVAMFGSIASAKEFSREFAAPPNAIYDAILNVISNSDNYTLLGSDREKRIVSFHTKGMYREFRITAMVAEPKNNQTRVELNVQSEHTFRFFNAKAAEDNVAKFFERLEKELSRN